MELIPTFTAILNTFKNNLSGIFRKSKTKDTTSKPPQEKLLEDYTSLYASYFPEHDELPTSDLFHYTNFDGLKKIITSKKLWVTDYKQLNDPSEVKYAFNTINELIRKNLETTKYSQFWQYFWRFFGRGITDDIEIFVVSFCQNANYLPAWRWYADDGAGFSIGFKKQYSYFKAYADRKKNSSEPLIKFEKIYYLQSNTENQLAKCISEFIQLTENYLSQHDIVDLKETATILVVSIIPLLSKIKHTAYKEEQESRIYEIETRSSNQRKIKNFWTQRLNNSPFVESVLRSQIDFNENDISSIWVGPRCNFTHAEKEIRKMLDENGYNNNIKIEQSDIPYRNNL